MKWVVVAIIACIVPYTWLTVRYRKEGPAFQPYQDTKDRAQVMRLLDGGFRRVDLPLARLVDPAPLIGNSADTAVLPGGLPPLLRDLLIDKPPVPSDFPQVDAPAAILAGAPYELGFTCTQPDTAEQPGSATLYLREQEAVFVIGYEALPGTLETRRLESRVRLTIPAHTFTAGTYQGTLIGARESRRWTFTVH